MTRIVPQYQTEFPDFPAADMPTVPAGFVDQSWHNDMCPSFWNEALRVVLFIDFPDVKEREFPECPRFTLHKSDENGATIGDSCFASDDWKQIVAQIAAVDSRPKPPEADTAASLLAEIESDLRAGYPDLVDEDPSETYPASVLALAKRLAALTWA